MGRKIDSEKWCRKRPPLLIMREFSIPRGSFNMTEFNMIERMLLDVMECHKNGKVYNGARKAGLGSKSKLISLDSI